MGWHDGHPIWDGNKGATISEPFYIKAYDEATWVRIIKGEYAPTITVEYSRDGTVWQTLGITGTGLSIDIPAGSKAWLRAKTNTWAVLGEGFVSTHIIICENPCEMGGNIMSLLYGNDFTGTEREFPDNSKHVFTNLFHGQGNEVVDASKLILPATTLNEYCYSGMFGECLSLTSAPELSATTLTNCCYMGMFNGCTNLNYIKCLATDISANNCLLNWVGGVAATGTFTKKAGVVWPSGKHGIPEGWIVVEE